MRIREFITDSFFFALAAVILLITGYLLYLAWQGEHPEPKQHWSKGPQDPEPTH